MRTKRRRIIGKHGKRQNDAEVEQEESKKKQQTTEAMMKRRRRIIPLE